MNGASALKRAIDLTLSAAMLVLTAPVLVVTGLLVRINLGSPMLFRQMRPGLNGKPFMLIKFRTMRDLRDDRGDLLPNDARLTPFGCALRATSLDELPELWNVLMGEMSLVGPRPLLMEYLPLYTAEQQRRHEVRPGITGWAQINGRNNASWEDRFRMDVWYVDNRTLWLDLRIMLMTLRTVVSRSDISQPGRSTIDRFGAAK